MSSNRKTSHEAEHFNTLAKQLNGGRISIIPRLIQERSHYVPNFSSFHATIGACDEVLSYRSVFNREMQNDYFTDIALVYYDLLAFHRILKVMQQYTYLSDTQYDFLHICRNRFDDFEHYSVDPIAAFFLTQLAPSIPDDPLFEPITPYLPSISAHPFTPSNGHQWSTDYVQRLPNLIASFRRIYRSRVGVHGDLNRYSDYSLDYDLTTESPPTAASVSVCPGTGGLISLYAPVNPSTAYLTLRPQPQQLHGYRESSIIPVVPHRSDDHIFDSEADFFRINSHDRFIEGISRLMSRRNYYFKGHVTYGSLGIGATYQSKIVHSPTMEHWITEAIDHFLDELVDVPTLTPALPASAIATAATANAAAQASRRNIYLHCKTEKISVPLDYIAMMPRLAPVYALEGLPLVAAISFENSTPLLAFIETSLSLWNLRSMDIFPFHPAPSSEIGDFYASPVHHVSNSIAPHTSIRIKLMDHHIPRE